ncbi:MAG: hypothetical protein ACLQGV_09555, partial [Bryobacteraceae bacterium]
GRRHRVGNTFGDQSVSRGGTVTIPRLLAARQAGSAGWAGAGLVGRRVRARGCCRVAGRLCRALPRGMPPPAGAAARAGRLRRMGAQRFGRGWARVIGFVFAGLVLKTWDFLASFVISCISGMFGWGAGGMAGRFGFVCPLLLGRAPVRPPLDRAGGWRWPVGSFLDSFRGW